MATAFGSRYFLCPSDLPPILAHSFSAWAQPNDYLHFHTWFHLWSSSSSSLHEKIHLHTQLLSQQLMIFCFAPKLKLVFYALPSYGIPWPSTYNLFHFYPLSLENTSEKKNPMWERKFPLFQERSDSILLGNYMELYKQKYFLQPLLHDTSCLRDCKCLLEENDLGTPSPIPYSNQDYIGHCRDFDMTRLSTMAS